MAGAIIIGIPVLRKPSTILVNVYSTSYGRGPYVDTQTRVENGLNIRLFSKIYGWMVAPQVYQAGDRALSASSPVF